MSPVIDIHAHVFRGRDIPLKGYLLSRSYPEWYIRLLAPVLFTVIERAIRGESHGPIVDLVKRLTFAYTGPGYRRWTDILSMDDMRDVAAKMIASFPKDRTGLYVPLMIDYEYWFKHSKNLFIAEQIDSMYRDVILPYKGRIHPFAPFDPARELAFRNKLPGPGGTREKYSSLELAKEAVRNRGFIGVKVYNTLGYRPLGNEQVDRERRGIFTRIHGRAVRRRTVGSVPVLRAGTGADHGPLHARRDRGLSESQLRFRRAGVLAGGPGKISPPACQPRPFRVEPAGGIHLQIAMGELCPIPPALLRTVRAEIRWV
jgi:hypothetical protein